MLIIITASSRKSYSLRLTTLPAHADFTGNDSSLTAVFPIDAAISFMVHLAQAKRLSVLLLRAT